jgi:hypothetical protein
VKHRSPLITLAAVALAFAIMFIVNMTVSPPGSGSTGIPSPPAAPVSAVAVQTTGADSTAASDLNAGNPQVTIDGESLHAARVNGDAGR